MTTALTADAECAECWGPVQLSPAGRSEKHGVWVHGRDGIRQTDTRCPGSGRKPKETS